LAAGLGSLRALPITAEINRRSAPHRQADHAVDLLAVADPAQVLAPGRLLSVTDEGLDPTVVSPAAKLTGGPEAHQRQSPSKRLLATRV
jgi:hypothetical protein